MPSVAWGLIEDFYEGSFSCEAPLHSDETEIPLAKWAMVITENGVTHINMICDSCMTRMAADLGTTPERGAMPRPT